MTGAAALSLLQVGKYYPPHKGGMESHLEDLCRELARSVEVRVLVAAEDRRTRREVRDGVPVTRAGTWLELAAAPFSPAMVGEIRRSRADLVHVHLPHPAAILAWEAAFAGADPTTARPRRVVTYHSDIVRQRWLGSAFAPLLHRFLASAGAIIATSPGYLESSPVLRAHRRRCRVVPHGIDLERFARGDGAAAGELRARFGPRIVLAVGRLIYYKGFGHLIRAMAGVDGTLVVVGDGPLRSALAAEVAAAGLGHRVHLVGEVGDVVPYYRAAEVFALPSVARSEAFGLVQVEAMAAGLPVVNTALDTGVPFVSRHGETGLTVPPGDAEALAAALRRLLGDPALRARLGEAGRRRAQEEFSLGRMVERTVEVYRQVVAGDRGRP